MMGRTDLLGKLATSTGPVANKVIGAEPGSGVRKVVEKVTGVSSVRLLPPYAKQRFSTWFKKRPKLRITKPQGKVTVFPTCLVEYQETGIGKDLVKVYERNGIECNITDGRLLWRPLAALGRRQGVHQGRGEERQDPGRRGTRRQRHRRAAADVRLHPEEGLPRLRRRRVVARDAALVAEHTYDAAEYLMKVHKGDDTELDTDFTGDDARRRSPTTRRVTSGPRTSASRAAT